MPEMFRKEINKLNYENKQKFKFQRLEFFRSDTDTLDHDKFDSKQISDNIDDDQLSKIRHMELYLFDQTADMMKLYAPDIKKAIEDGNHQNF